MVGESQIPFPFLNGMVVEQKDSDGNPQFYQINGQATISTLEYDYAITPGGKDTDQTFTVSGADAFKTSSNTLKEWVSWIDNVNLKAVWSINSQTINQLNGVDYGLTWETSPIGTYVMSLATVNQPTPNVSYNLINKSSSYPVRGTFKVILAAYKVKPVQQSDTYTSLDYLSGGA